MIDHKFREKIDLFLKDNLSDDPILKSYQQLEIIRRVSLSSPNLFLEAGSSHYSNFVLPPSDNIDISSAMKTYFSECEKFGYALPKQGQIILNPYDLKPGDVLLISPKIPTIDGIFSKIKFTETFKTQFILTGEKEHARYTHAAIIRHGHRVLEAIPFTGTTEADGWHYMDTEKWHFKVIRLNNNDSAGQEVVREVSKFFGANYDLLDLIMLKAKSQGWTWLSNTLAWTKENQIFICSGLYAAACDYLNIDLQLDEYSSIDDGPSLVTPAHLSLSPAFDVVFSSERDDNLISQIEVSF